MRAEIVIKGIVQGVGFRPFVYRTAVENKLTGYVRNRADAGVEIILEGSDGAVKEFIESLNKNKPSLAEIYDIAINYMQGKGEFTNFSIAGSSRGGELSGSVIPYDVSICDRCLNELRDLNNRRHDYFFITCTECGPRYTTIRELPYDRANTTMHDFPMCGNCIKEYENPLDRRFHAQTIACEQCGPHVFLTDNTGKLLENDGPIREAGRLVEEGHIVAVKGNGGFHIATATTKSEPIRMLRNVKHRSQKPFSIMARDLATIKSVADVNDVEEELLISSARPIVLLRKSEDYCLSELIAPGLHNIGIMLPYTGLHHMLFDNVKEPAFIMTSANAPSEPIVVDNNEALEKIGNIVDFFLFHDRTIAQRCDDSVIRVHNTEKRIIRRSRGYAPSPIRLKMSKRYSALGVGAEENVNSCILLGDKAFISQYIGDVEKLETFRFHEQATRHLLAITKGKIDVVSCDLHPQYITTRLAQELGKEFRCLVYPVQHHFAHASSLMAEKGIDEIVGIICDGAGYGLDGNIWGGEILHCTSEGFKRLGHLQEQPMVGGDLAAKYPLRMVSAILGWSMDVNELMLSRARNFPHGEREVEIIFKQISNGRMPITTSCGRVLDAVSALLGICYERTYEGEPAIKLESTAIFGKDVLKIDPKIDKGIINTTSLVQRIFDNVHKYSVPDLACSAESYIARSLAELAMNEARRIGVKDIGFSGGVAYNEHISIIIERILKENQYKLLIHDQVPPGDGGISFGQAIAASNVLQA